MSNASAFEAVKSIYYWAATHVGHVRSQNEDAFAVSGSEALSDQSACEGDLDRSNPWALVADGMGGHPAGDVASKLAVACLGTLISPAWQPRNIGAALIDTDKALRYAMALDPSLLGMGTTIAGAVVRRGQVFTFNIGDSRIFHLREGRLTCISKDHAVEKHILTMCLGGNAPSDDLEPDSFSHRAMTGTRILLTTDGLTNLVHQNEILRLLKGPSPAKALIDAALNNGGYDNVTSVVLEFRGATPQRKK